MEKLKQEIRKELKEVEEQGISMNNLDTTFKLVDILKNLNKIEGEEMRDYRYDDYGRRGMPRGRYSEGRMRDYIDKMMDGVEMYEYGKERSRYGHGEDERMYDGLEKLMYAVCLFVESAMDFAETPQEKEIIRKHIQKLSHV